MVTGTEKDPQTVEAVLAQLQPRCPRCRTQDVTPRTCYFHTRHPLRNMVGPRCTSSVSDDVFTVR